MTATPDARVRTRTFARVLGPFLVIVPAIGAYRLPQVGPILAGFFGNPALVWMTGGMLLLGGIVIIALHQYWSGLTAVIISLFGWFLALRGIVLLAAPQLIARGAAAASISLLPVRIGFAFVVLIGAYLTFVGWIAKPPAAT